MKLTKDKFYKRQTTLSEIGTIGQQKLQDAEIAVVGCGGLGSVAAVSLAATWISGGPVNPAMETMRPQKPMSGERSLRVEYSIPPASSASLALFSVTWSAAVNTVTRESLWELIESPRQTPARPK